MSFERDNEDQTEVTQRRKAMLHRNLMMVGLLAIAGLQLSACKHVAAAKTEPEHPAQVKRVEGTEFSSVTLTEKAVQRLGLKTDQVRAEKVTQKNQQVGERKVVPYSALIYDSHGQDRKSTRLNSSHSQISYAVFCLKKKIQLSSYMSCSLPTFSPPRLPLCSQTSATPVRSH